MNLKDNDRAVSCYEKKGDLIGVFSGEKKSIKLLIIDNLDIPQMQKGRGVILQKFKNGKTLFSICLDSNEDILDKNNKVLQKSIDEIRQITGQQPIVTTAKKSIAGFKVREGWPIGTKVTLRANRMYDFLERLIGIAIPRIRDFRGISPKQFDGRGNFSMGVSEQIIFPEIDYDKIDKLRGLDISITTSAKSDDEARALLKAFNFPLKN